MRSEASGKTSDRCLRTFSMRRSSSPRASRERCRARSYTTNPSAAPPLRALVRCPTTATWWLWRAARSLAPAGRTTDEYGNIDDETPSFSIALYKPYRGQGIGAALMRALLGELREAGYARVSLPGRLRREGLPRPPAACRGQRRAVFPRLPQRPSPNRQGV